MTTITKPKLSARSKKLYVSFSIDGEQVRRSLNIEDTKANRKIAETQLIPQLIIKAHSGEFFNNTKIPTVDEFAKVSFEIHKNNRKHFTQKSYIRSYDLHIKPTFGKMKLNKIKPSLIASWQNNLLDKLASSTVQTIRIIFHTMFDDAMRDEFIEKNPISLIKAPKSEERRLKKPFSIEEINKILNFITPKMKAYFAIGFYTGMRTGEIIALKWSDIDLEKKTINISRAIRQGVEDTPKTKNSIREVEILDVLIPYLIEHRKLSKDSSIYVFETYNNKPFTTSDKISSHYWRPCLKEENIEYRNLYQMRHSFASMMISNGEDILWVSSMLGHKDSTTTLEKYARYIKQDKRTRGNFLLAQN